MRVALVLFFVAFVASKKTGTRGFPVEMVLRKGVQNYEEEDDEEGTPVIPKTSFTCDGKIDGFYADIETDCKVYHYCQTFVFPDDDPETMDWPFFCPPTTIFRQQYLTCAKPHKNFKCEDSEQYFDVNEKPPVTVKPPVTTPIPPEEEPTTSAPLETEPPLPETTETPQESTTLAEKPTTKPPNPDDGFLLPPLQPGEAEEQFLPPFLPYFVYPSIFPPWFHLNAPILPPGHPNKFPVAMKYMEKGPVQTLDDYLKKVMDNLLKKGITPASTKLLDPKTPPFVLPKLDKKLFETSYTIKNGKLTDEPFQFKFFTKDDKSLGPR